MIIEIKEIELHSILLLQYCQLSSLLATHVQFKVIQNVLGHEMRTIYMVDIVVKLFRFEYICNNVPLISIQFRCSSLFWLKMFKRHSKNLIL